MHDNLAPRASSLSSFFAQRKLPHLSRLAAALLLADASKLQPRRGAAQHPCLRTPANWPILGASGDVTAGIPWRPLMITVGMNYHVLPGRQADFEAKFAAVISALRAAAGHSSSTLWKDVSDDASYLITSEWSEEQAFMDFIHSQAFKDVTSWGKEQILSGRPQHKIYKH
jgi:heme-degrading monooxygenase HmoA